MSLVAVADAASRPRVRARTKTSFYVTMTVFMITIVLAGFWPSYYGALLRGDAARPLVIHVHGAVFGGWMVLLLAQVALAWRGHVQWHRRVGRWGIAYGFLVLVMGVIVGIAAPVMHLNAGEWPRERAVGFLLVTMGDMVLFGSLFVAAVAYRRRPEIHKRLMLAATVALLFAAVGRINAGVLHSAPLAAVIWLSPLLIGMVYDWYSARRVHATYVVSIAWLSIGAFRLALVQSAGWQRIGGAILDVF